MKNEIKQEPIFVDSDKNGVIHTDWRTDKLKNLELTSSYNRLKDKKKAHKCCDCGTYLEFDFDPITGVRKLRKANFCKLRLCPMCIKRRQNLWADVTNYECIRERLCFCVFDFNTEKCYW